MLYLTKLPLKNAQRHHQNFSKKQNVIYRVICHCTATVPWQLTANIYRLHFPPSAVLPLHPFEPSQYCPCDKDGMICDERYSVSPWLKKRYK